MARAALKRSTAPGYAQDPGGPVALLQAERASSGLAGNAAPIIAMEQGRRTRRKRDHGPVTSDATATSMPSIPSHRGAIPVRIVMVAALMVNATAIRIA